MKKRLTEHISSLVFVLIILVFFANILPDEGSAKKDNNTPNPVAVQLQQFDLQDPLQLAIFMETARYLKPKRPLLADSLISVLEAEQQKELKPPPRGSKPLSFGYIAHLIWMTIVFYLIFILVMAISYYGVESLAVWRFVQEKQGGPDMRTQSKQIVRTMLNNVSEFKNIRNYQIMLKNLSKRIGLVAAGLVAFSPAYVIAYAIKTRFSTSSVLFMIVLAVFSNGLLITYMHKFYTFLVAESRKGYAETAVVKNLSDNYRGYFHSKNIFSIKKRFPGHVFDSIFMNARMQYISTFKEQAAFLITGLIIIEMALNIQGHLCYELLQNLLYKNYGAIAIILYGIFLIVKLTEIAVDYTQLTINRRLSNE